MVLNYQNIIHNLLFNIQFNNKDYNITKEEIINCELKIIAFENTLNNTFLVERSLNRKSLFIKQSFIIDEERIDAFENERAILNELSQLKKKELIKNIPKQVNIIDKTKLISVQELISGSESLSSKLKNEVTGQSTLQNLFKELGFVIDKIHKIKPNESFQNKRLKLKNTFPFSFRLLDNPDIFEQSRFYRILKKLSTEEFNKFIRSERKNWKKHKNLIHKDLTIKNILIVADDNPIIIDWETCGIGDGLWDIATLFFDNNLKHLSDYLDPFLMAYLNTEEEEEIVKSRQKILRYKTLIQLLELSRNFDNKNLSEKITKIINEFR